MLNISAFDILFVALGFIFQVWPLMLVQALDTRRDPFRNLMALWLILAAIRAFIAFDSHPMLLFTVVPEPANTLLFLATGAALLVILFFVRERRLRSLSLIVLVVVVVLLAFGSMLTRTTSSTPFALVGQPAASARSQASTAFPTTSAAPASYAMGDVVALSDSALVVIGWSAVPVSAAVMPRAGYRAMDVDLLVVNTGKTMASFDPAQRASLKDQDDQRYATEPYSSALGGIRLEKPRSLYPGERIRGKLRYQVPDAASGLMLTYATDTSGSQRMRVRLGVQPAAVELPAVVPGEFVASLHQVGESLSDGVLKLTLNKVSGSILPAPKPSAGRKFVVVDLTVENRGDKSFDIGGVSQMLLRDTAFEQYSLDAAAMQTAKVPTPLGKLAPGMKVRGEVWFSVPDTAQELVFMFDANYVESIFSYQFDPAKRVLIKLF